MVFRDLFRRLNKNHKLKLKHIIYVGENILVERTLLYSSSSQSLRFTVESRFAYNAHVEHAIEWCRENYGPAATDQVEQVVRGRKRFGYPAAPHWLFHRENDGRMRFAFDTWERAMMFKVLCS